MILIVCILSVAAIPAALCSFYLLWMTLLSARPRMPAKSSRQLRFDVIVPAHNEMAIIERTIASLRALDWPHDRFRVIAIADNCTDDTAGVARRAGATVMERQDPVKRGKGYALKFAFTASADNNWADAVVVVDADAEVSPNLLEAFAARLELGLHAVQAHYGVRNSMASWRTRLITIAKGAFHIVRSRARERMGLSCGIRGNGWCVTHQLLARVPYQAFSLTEDLEYGIDIGLAGYRVAYADEARADADMVSSEAIASKQRQRWEAGRFLLVRSRTAGLLKMALRRRDAVCTDLALDLLVLPLSYVALNVLGLTVLSVLASLLNLAPIGFLWIGLGCCCCLVAYVARGWWLSGVGARGFIDLLGVPWFLLWKVLLMVRRGKSKEWVKTGRETS